MIRISAIFLVLILSCSGGAGAAVCSFDNLSLPADAYWNGSDGSGGFVSGDAFFGNYYDPAWGSWDGWAYSSMTDTVTRGWTNQYSAIAGGGVHGSANYALAYDAGAWGGASPPSISFGASSGEDYDTTISGVWITTTTWAYYSMLEGDSYVNAFSAGDWQKVLIAGIDSQGNRTANTVEFYLADYTSSNPDDWYIVSQWTWVDLSSLGDVIGLEFDFDGSQVDFVPAYVAVDNLNAVPIPGAVWLVGSGLLGMFGIRMREKNDVGT
ncbi:MAG: DUF4465 domain-containing protein [Deltaproteobacteria bacterium]|nr:DUF4465 domain-containing protein [Deltaproteobacteria bacterium]